VVFDPQSHLDESVCPDGFDRKARITADLERLAPGDRDCVQGDRWEVADVRDALQPARRRGPRTETSDAHEQLRAGTTGNRRRCPVRVDQAFGLREPRLAVAARLPGRDDTKLPATVILGG